MDNAVALRPEQPMELSVDQLTSHVGKIQQVMAKVMQENQHFGVIPGTDKPTLLKPGAEKLALVFRLAPSFEIKRSDLPNNHREFEIVCTLTHIPTGQVMGQGVGSCSTMESKYRWRRGEAESTGNSVPQNYWNMRKVNPAGAQQLIGGKGFVTLKVDGQWFIAKKSDERVENADIADTYNTVLKMAKKRAQVDATLTATAASDIFTQDLEETVEDHPEATIKPEPAPTPQQASKPLKTAKQGLGDAILAHVGGDREKASDLLYSITGKRSIKDISEAGAMTAMRQFEMDFLNVPDANDDIPHYPVPHDPSQI